jgi:hypothetical protein
LTGVDFTNPDKDESLRQYLLVCLERYSAFFLQIG